MSKAAVLPRNVEVFEQPCEKKLARQILSHPLMMPYHRLAALVVAINLSVFFGMDSISLAEISNIVLTNFSVAILIRQQYVINWLFKLATRMPLSWPLQIRWAAGKVYHFGGIHVGGFLSGSVWLAYLTYQVARNVPSSEAVKFHSLLPLLLVHLLVLLAMMIMALPTIRAKHHNQFEAVGRFGGWTSLALFWVQHLYVNSFFTPQTVVLSVLTFSVALPWLRLKRVSVDIKTPSDHVALAKFNYGVKPFAGSSTDLSWSPLLEWHSFANIPSPDEAGYRLTISRAGDWTGEFINKKPKHIWVKGIPTAGVGNIETLFKKVIWVATGSGVGPCIPHLLSQKVPAKLVWSARDPEKTYGKELVNEILAVQPAAVIWNTQTRGKPDLVSLALEAYKDFGAEAVICISNKKTTFHVNYELESRGIPSFGAIWDS